MTELDGAELVVSDEDMGVLYVWYGGPAVSILNEDGDRLDDFRMSQADERQLTADEVYSAILAYQQEMMDDDPS